MERKEFLSKLGIGMAVVCLGCGIAACGSNPGEEATPDEGGNGGDNGDLLSANLETELKNVGEFKIANGIILVRLAQGNVPASFTAVQRACTHQNILIDYNNAQGKFICPGHGSQFSASGAVLEGPATVPLKQYTVNINGGTLTVKG